MLRILIPEKFVVKEVMSGKDILEIFYLVPAMLVLEKLLSQAFIWIILISKTLVLDLLELKICIPKILVSKMLELRVFMQVIFT